MTQVATERWVVSPDPPVQGATVCRVCGGDRLAFRLKKKDFDILQCVGCGFQFVSPMPDEKVLAEFYQTENYFSSDSAFGYSDYESKREFYRGLFRAYLRVLGRYGPPGRLLDLGCGNGEFMRLAREAAWEASGVEISERSREEAARHSGGRVLASLQDLSGEQGSFDVITMWEFIEHLPDPDRVLTMALPLLKDGGLIALTTPNTRNLTAIRRPDLWTEFKPPEHLQFFDFQTLRQWLTRRYGLKIVELRGMHQDFRLAGDPRTETLLQWALRLRREHPRRSDPLWWVYAALVRILRDFPRRILRGMRLLDAELLYTGIFCVVRK